MPNDNRVFSQTNAAGPLPGISAILDKQREEIRFSRPPLYVIIAYCSYPEPSRGWRIPSTVKRTYLVREDAESDLRKLLSGDSWTVGEVVTIPRREKQK